MVEYIIHGHTTREALEDMGKNVIVRCRDCKHLITDEIVVGDEDEPDYILVDACFLHYDFYEDIRKVNLDDYCAWGEQRGGGR